MAANPITETELEAYCRRRHIVKSVWEGDLLMRLDDAVMAIWAEKAGKGGSVEVEARIDDPRAVRGLLSSIRERMG